MIGKGSSLLNWTLTKHGFKRPLQRQEVVRRK